MNIELLQGIAKSDYRKNLVAYLKQVQDHVADIRNGNYTNETRVATIETIQKLLVDKLHTMSGVVNKDKDNYF